nr:MAG: hypothetical protein [Jiangsu sediment cysto-like virus 6]
MSTYIVPNDGDFDILAATTKKAGVPLITPSSLREMILETDGVPLAIVGLGAEPLLILNRHAATLLSEVPTVVTSVPGLIYSGEWFTLASAFPAVDWTELERKLAKSGHTAFTTRDLQKRSVGSVANERLEDDDLADATDGA